MTDAFDMMTLYAGLHLLWKMTGAGHMLGSHNCSQDEKKLQL